MLKSVMSLLNEPNDIVIRSSLCGHTYSNKFSCSLCVDNCPTQGLVWRDNTWQAEDCNRCGQCVAICPSHVFKLDEDSLVKKCQTNKPALLTCDVLLNGIKDSYNGLIVNMSCLNQLYPELLLYILAEQGQLNIYLEPEKCSQCYEFKCQNLIDKIQAIGDFKARINWIENREGLPDLAVQNEAPVMNRREFLGTMLRRGKKASVEVINETISDYNQLFADNSNQNNGKLKAQPEKRLKLLMALQVFNQKNIAYEITELPYRYVQVDKCQFCGICSKLCPGDALEIKESDDSKSLHYWPLKCNGCGLCQNACVMGEVNWGKAMQIEDLIKKKGEILLAAAKADNCNSCGEKTFFYPDNQEHSCYVCRLKSKNPQNINPFKRWKFDSA